MEKRLSETVNKELELLTIEESKASAREVMTRRLDAIREEMRKLQEKEALLEADIHQIDEDTVSLRQQVEAQVREKTHLLSQKAELDTIPARLAECEDEAVLRQEAERWAKVSPGED